MEEEVSSTQGLKTMVSIQPFCLQFNLLQELILGFALLTPNFSHKVELIKPHLAPLVILPSSLGCLLSYYNVTIIGGVPADKAANSVYHCIQGSLDENL